MRPSEWTVAASAGRLTKQPVLDHRRNLQPVDVPPELVDGFLFRVRGLQTGIDSGFEAGDLRKQIADHPTHWQGDQPQPSNHKRDDRTWFHPQPPCLGSGGVPCERWLTGKLLHVVHHRLVPWRSP